MLTQALTMLLKRVYSGLKRFKGLKMHDIKQQISIIWDALEAYREDLIQEGDEMHDAIWDEVCTAMAVIEENLKVAA